MRYKLQIRKMQLAVVAFLFSVGLANAQQASVKGIVKDGKEPLPGASIFVQGGGQGVISNADGSFQLTLPAGSHVVIASFTGLAPEQKSVSVKDGETIELNFDLKTTSLNELVVLGSRGEPRSQLDTPVPVDVIDVKNLIKDVGQVSLNQILNYVAPSFNSNTQVLGDGTDNIDPASLRRLRPVNAATNVEADAQTFGSKVITDPSLSYDISKAIRFTLGANSLLDIYPDETKGGNRGNRYFIYSVLASNSVLTVDLLSPV